MTEKSAQKDIFCREEIIGSSTLAKVGTARIVLSMDAVAKYHMLVMPIRHVERIEELTDEEHRDIVKALSSIEEFYKARGIEGYKLVLLSGPAAGQTIQHVHWHVIPGNAEFVTDPKRRSVHYSGEELAKEADVLRRDFRSR